nr:MAG TPA: hypothetical protein [Caudoviricetes sp.]
MILQHFDDMSTRDVKDLSSNGVNSSCKMSTDGAI